MSSFLGLADWVKEYKTRYSLTSFIETGCCDGDGIRAARSFGFRPIYSCDIDPTKVQKCSAEFPDTTIRNLHSPDFLTQLLPGLRENCLFWLDAHFAPTYSQQEDAKFPLLQELALVGQYPNHVILVDDTRCLADQGRQHEIPEYYHVPVTLKDLINAVSEHYTFDPSLLGYQQGVGTFIPRGK